MGKVKSKIVDEAANKKAAADARKQRDLKKFGKQIQVAKLQERDKAKRETLDKINLLKRSTASCIWSRQGAVGLMIRLQNGRTPIPARQTKRISSM